MIDDDASAPRRPHPLDLAWLRLGDRWSWLAVAPAEPGLDAAPLARALVVVGAEVTGAEVEFLDGTALGPADVRTFVTALRKERRGVRAVVALACPLGTTPGGVAALEVARSADGVVLCVRKGETRTSDVRAAAAALGVERIVCSLLVEGTPPAPAPAG